MDDCNNLMQDLETPSSLRPCVSFCCGLLQYITSNQDLPNNSPPTKMSLTKTRRLFCHGLSVSLLTPVGETASSHFTTACS